VTNPVLEIEKSVLGKAWKLRCSDSEKILELERRGGLDVLTATLLAGRNVNAKSAQDFLDPTLRRLMPDPDLFSNMGKAAARIMDAVQNNETVTVFADYDVDGATSASQLIRWSRAMGNEFGLYVPDRVKEGYGPTIEAFEHLKAIGNDLVITVDCGAAAHSALEGAQALDLDIVVIDHHQMHGDLPPAHAIVNPNRADDSSGMENLAAAGVTFMVLVALNREAKKRNLSQTPDLIDYLGLAALGTICDVVSLTGLNRAIVHQGLKILSRMENIGIRALCDVANKSGPVTVYDAGFIIGPRINAGGRIGLAEMGANLLSTENAQTAYSHAAELDRVNSERKQMQSQMTEEAITQAKEQSKDSSVIISSMPGWHPGIIGIVAGRLKDQFNRPAIVIGINEQGIGKGSGRSISGVDLGKSINAAFNAGIVTSGGGHAMAGGLTIDGDKVEVLREFLEQELGELVETARQKMSLKIDSFISVGALGHKLMETVESVGPFGAGNPQPVFVLTGLKVVFAKMLRGGHIRCRFEDKSGMRFSGICFRAEEQGFSDILMAANPPLIHIAGQIKRDTWNGGNRIDFNIVDIAMVNSE